MSRFPARPRSEARPTLILNEIRWVCLATQSPSARPLTEPTPRRLVRRAGPASDKNGSDPDPASPIQSRPRLAGLPIMLRNSRRVFGSARNEPSMRLVTMSTPDLWMPRVVMQ